MPVTVSTAVPGGAVRAGGVLREGGRGHRDHAGRRGEYAGSCVIGVLGGGGQRRAVQRHRRSVSRGSKVSVITMAAAASAAVLPVFWMVKVYVRRLFSVTVVGERDFVDGQCRRRLRCHRLRGGNGVCQPLRR